MNVAVGQYDGSGFLREKTHTRKHIDGKQTGEEEGDGTTYVERFMGRKRARPPGRGASVNRVPAVRHVAGMLAVVVCPQFIQYVVLQNGKVL